MSQSAIETVDTKTSTLTLSLDSALYPRDVLYAAAYVFLDRAYVLLDRADERFLIHVRGKQPLDEPTLRTMAGEFENELLAQALRLRVIKANQRIIESVTTLAIAGAAGGMHESEPSDENSVDDGHDDSLDFLDDPLGISKPWQPKKDEA
jgi:His-Xaa-Ser system protein HxsD